MKERSKHRRLYKLWKFAILLHRFLKRAPRYPQMWVTSWILKKLGDFPRYRIWLSYVTYYCSLSISHLQTNINRKLPDKSVVCFFFFFFFFCFSFQPDIVSNLLRILVLRFQASTNLPKLLRASWVWRLEAVASISNRSNYFSSKADSTHWLRSRFTRVHSSLMRYVKWMNELIIICDLFTQRLLFLLLRKLVLRWKVYLSCIQLASRMIKCWSIALHWLASKLLIETRLKMEINYWSEYAT
jgi:hypothetical protein